MNIDKDYYAMLGVVPTAEAAVIKAAYRALSKLYHPDVYQGHDAKQKMSDLNEAYDVLSDVGKRKRYDDARGDCSHSGEEFFNDSFTTESGTDPLEEDWLYAVKYYPDLVDLEARLSRLSGRLAYTYKALLLETKNFAERRSVAYKIELEFLHQYFGQDENLLRFAKEMIEKGRKDVLRELNRSVKLLGSGDPTRIISRLRSEFEVPDIYREAEGNISTAFLVFCIPIIIVVLLILVFGA